MAALSTTSSSIPVYTSILRLVISATLLIGPSNAFLLSPASSPSIGSRASVGASKIKNVHEARVAPLRVVWSNPQETIDYMRWVEGKQPTEATDQPSVIIGGGTLGKALAEMGGTGQDLILGRGQEIPTTLALTGGMTLEDFPIYVAVPEWEVENVIKLCPTAKRKDLVFMQQACMENLLKRYGLCHKEQTQCLPYFSISPIGRAIEGRVKYDTSKTDGEPKYAGETVVCGKWRGAVAERLRKKDLVVTTLDYSYWRKNMLEKLIFDSVFNLIGNVHPNAPKTFGEIADNHWAEVDDMVYEMSRGLAKTIAVVLVAHTERRLRGLAEGERWRDRKARLPTKEEYPFYNGYFREISTTFTSRRFPSPFPQHDEYLDFCREKQLITYPLDDQPSVSS